MASLDEKTKIPIGWAASILFAIVGLVFQAGVSYTRFAALDAEFSRHLAAEEAAKTKGFETELRVQKLEILIGNIDLKLGQIDKKLDRINEKGSK